MLTLTRRRYGGGAWLVAIGLARASLALEDVSPPRAGSDAVRRVQRIDLEKLLRISVEAVRATATARGASPGLDGLGGPSLANRIVADELSEYLFILSHEARENIEAEWLCPTE